MSLMSGSAWSEMGGMAVPQWSWSAYSTIGQVSLGVLVVVGLAAGTWLSMWKPALYVPALRLASWMVMLAALVAHALTAWVLEVDPSRNQSGIPLPEPFSALASMLTLALQLAGPLFVGVAAAQIVRAVRDRKLDGMTVLAPLVALYVAWVVPWAGGIMWD